MDDEDLQQQPGDEPQITENDDGSADVALPDDLSGITELPDGSAIVELDEEGPEANPDFYANLAETHDPYELDTLAMRYLRLIEKDKRAREERDKQYEEGIRRTGMGNDAPGGAQFMGASRAVHPVMAEGCVDFAARAIKELFPPDGPVKTKILGQADDAKMDRAERKRDYLNWQLTEQVEEFRDEQEQLLTQLPLGGSQYLKLWFDQDLKRPCAEFLPIDRMILPFAAANFYTAQRAAEVHEITQWEFEKRVRKGLYRDISIVRATMEPEPTAAQKATNKIEGRQLEDNEDGIRTVYHIYTWLELDDDKYSKGKMAPYILMVDELDNEVVGLYRNWEDGDETMTKLDWVVEFKFIPWRGVYAVGLPHLIGGLSAALTGALRALLDSAHINNTATMLKLKSAKMSGQSQNVDVTQIVEVEGAPGVNDIRMIAMPMPFNPPSPVLFQLMGFLDQAAKGVVTTSEEKIADISSQAPVGTTQALIEQGAAVFSAIHARLHASQARVLKILCRLNRWYFDDQKRSDSVTDLPITREDFAQNTDVVPVSDPHIFSETQRMAQMQSVLQLAQNNPDLFDRKAVMARALKQMKVPDINELLVDTPAPQQRTSADENAAMLIGQPAYAYMPQDHIAHIQDHLQFAMNPFFGQSPFADPSYLNHVIEHVKQHMTLWYINRSNAYVAQAQGGRPVDDYEDAKVTGAIDKLYTTVGAHVMMDSQQVFQQLQSGFAALIQMAQQRQQQQKAALPPDAQVVHDTAMAETQRKSQKDAADAKLAQAKLQQQQQKDAQDAQLKAAELAAAQQQHAQDLRANLLEHGQSLQSAEAIESARINHEAVQNTADRIMSTAQSAQPPAAPAQPQGAPNGNQ